MSKNQSATAAIIGGFIVFCLKLAAFFISGSVALLSDALESIVNIIASFMMFISIRISGAPADVDHPYGHEKVENISAFVEGALVIVAGLLIAYTAIGRLFNPVELGSIDIALGISLLATVTNGGLSLYLMRSAKAHGSMALEGDAKHLLSDVLSSIGVVIGLFIASLTGWTILDPLLALVMACIVFKMGTELVLKAGNGLLDQAADDEQKKIEDLLNAHHPQFVDYHNVKTRRSGNKVFAELHLIVDPNLTVQKAHDLTKHLEEELHQEMPEVSLTIHVEPPKAHGDSD
ncbi:MAG: cation diffusion facilitator family transporter [Candidatus Bathyarchaeota archaeon]|nr:cation diffusion facilitator family transporter [Candidatus Bathyarchaeota archaeon]